MNETTPVTATENRKLPQGESGTAPPKAEQPQETYFFRILGQLTQEGVSPDVAANVALGFMHFLRNG